MFQVDVRLALYVKYTKKDNHVVNQRCYWLLIKQQVKQKTDTNIIVQFVVWFQEAFSIVYQ